jgi:hypothetical protein
VKAALSSGNQKAFGSPAFFRISLAVWRELIPASTVTFLPDFLSAQIS